MDLLHCKSDPLYFFFLTWQALCSLSTKFTLHCLNESNILALIWKLTLTIIKYSELMFLLLLSFAISKGVFIYIIIQGGGSKLLTSPILIPPQLKKSASKSTVHYVKESKNLVLIWKLTVTNQIQWRHVFVVHLPCNQQWSVLFISLYRVGDQSSWLHPSSYTHNWRNHLQNSNTYTTAFISVLHMALWPVGLSFYLLG